MPRKSDRFTAKQKPPAFQLYAGDWVLSTLGMPRELKGIYVDLLCWSWENGPLPDDPAWRQRIMGGSAKSCANLWNALRPRWKKTAKGWVNPRLERQRQVQQAFEKRGEKGADSRWQASVKHRSSIAQASPKRMLERWPSSSSSSSSSSSKDQDQPAAPAPSLPPFKVYAAIAKAAVKETATNDLGDVAEAFKKKCAQQGLPYDANLVTKALHTATRRRA